MKGSGLILPPSRQKGPSLHPGEGIEKGRGEKRRVLYSLSRGGGRKGWSAPYPRKACSEKDCDGGGEKKRGTSCNSLFYRRRKRFQFLPSCYIKAAGESFNAEKKGLLGGGRKKGRGGKGFTLFREGGQARVWRIR